MKSRFLNIFISNLACLLVMLFAAYGDTFAFSPDFYSSSSRLASGKWKRVSVSSTGMHFISNSDLRSWGFDPAKVHVFGYGGRELPDEFNSTCVDDLPVLPCVRTANGIVFFAVDNVTWKYQTNDVLPYTHTINRYSDKSYYFISDIDVDDNIIADATDISAGVAAPDTTLNSFTSRLLHERDLMVIANTGALYLGEDFRTNNSQNFSFRLPDMANDSVFLHTRFGAYITNGSGSLVFTANGRQLPKLNKDNINAVTSSESFLIKADSKRVIEGISDKLDLRIQFSSTGSVKTAALDFIEVNYLRRLRLDNGQLFFSDNYNGWNTQKEHRASLVRIEGCSSSTVIWDVSDPARPGNVPFKLNGSVAEFTVTNKRHREFMAFNPENVTAKPEQPVDIANQNIHALPQPDMVIITMPDFMETAENLAEMHRKNDGMTVHVLTPEPLYNEFSSGVPDVGAFRKALKMWYDRSRESDNPFKYCMLLGRPTADLKNIKGASANRMPIWQSRDDNSQTTSYSTDDFIGMVDDSENFNMSTAKIRVAVGRWPVKSASEANDMFRKYQNYVNNPNLGAWRNSVMCIADDQDDGEHLDQMEKMWSQMTRSATGRQFLYEKLYLDAYPLSYTGTGAGYPEAKKQMFKKWNEGVMLINYIGHANPKSWTHEGLLNWTEMNSFSNSNLPFLYAATCEFLRWDDDDDVSGAEIMWLNTKGGVIGMICPSRSVFITSNGPLSEQYGATFFSLNPDGRPKSVGEIFIGGKNKRQATDTNKLRYGLLADPAMRLPIPTNRVVVEKIGENDIASKQEPDTPEDDSGQQERPDNVIPARSRMTVSGSVRDAAGNILSDFNGTLYLSLFDAEKVVETYGNGKDGRVSIYNDWKNRLYNTAVKVENGIWSTQVMTPLEIDNLYNNALISMYACSDDGREANAAFTDLYVYGYDPNAAPDDAAPKIEELRLNSRNFADGDWVNATPVLFATVSDDSGINVSDSGIGHKITLTLDGRTHYDDLNNFFRQNADNPCRGTIIYPMPEMSSGEHTVELMVWDYANNSSRASVSFNVGVGKEPQIVNLSSNASPAKTSTVFSIETDRPFSSMTCLLEVFDLSGRTVWKSDDEHTTDIDSSMTVNWDLRDSGGVRVPRGIYMYRATVTTPEGTHASKTRKMVVAAP